MSMKYNLRKSENYDIRNTKQIIKDFGLNSETDTVKKDINVLKVT